MTTKQANPWRGVNTAQRHQGQICYPVVEVRWAGPGVREVRWHWVDQSIGRGQPGREYAHGTARGDFWAVVRALEANDIYTDDSTL